MKIHHLLDNLDVALSNEENKFINSNSDVISLDSLHDRESLIAHNLVRKGVYDISKDSTHLIKQEHGQT